jgi:hypothetical protein
MSSSSILGTGQRMTLTKNGRNAKTVNRLHIKLAVYSSKKAMDKLPEV